jgi:uncharacterized protein YjbI with pentapeptide repeats
VTDSELRARWKTADGSALRAQVREWLGKGGRAPKGIELHEGRIDLRGIELMGLDRSVPGQGTRGSARDVMLTGVRWRRIDFSGANLQHLRLFSSTVEDCLFEDTPCDDLRLWDTTVTDSSFAKAKLRHSAIGTWHEKKRNRWRNVSFDAADLSNASAEACELSGVSFRGARLNGMDFSQAQVVDCVFTGKMKDVLFDGRKLPERADPAALRRVEFRDAVFDEVEFRGCLFDEVRLPNQPGVRLINNFPVVARKAIELAAEFPTDYARVLESFLEYLLRSPGLEGTGWVFNRGDFVSRRGDAYAEFVDHLFVRAEVEVGSPRVSKPT